MVDLANAPDQQQAVQGPDAIREAWTLWSAAFDDLRVDVEEYTALGDRVICRANWVGRGKGSGISIDLWQYDLYEFRHGKIVSATIGLSSMQAAVEAAS
jgi:ketosteroid isomerase-like protein